MNNTTYSTTAIIALVVSLVALIIAWVAYNRTGVDLEAVMQREMDEAMIELNANFEEWERTARQETAENLREAAGDVENDTEPNNVGE